MSRIEAEVVKIVNESQSAIVTILVEFTTEETAECGDPNCNKRIGAGVIISSDGTVITTQSVIDHGKNFTVLFQDGCRIPGRVIGEDRETNLALLMTEPHRHGCYPIPLSTAGNSEIGSIGVVLGHTLISEGIAVGWGMLSKTWLGGDDYWSDQLYALQGTALMTQAGAGVIDIRGHLIGICDNKIAGHDGAWAVIPVSTIHKVVKVLKEAGCIQRGWLGICCEPSTPDENTSGMEIVDIITGSPADRGGMKVGDVIVSLNGDSIADLTTLRRRITGVVPAQNVTLGLQRINGSNEAITVRVASLTDDPLRQRRCRSRTL